MTVYQCEDSLEGVFTAVYRAYEDRRDHTDTVISLDEELFLFAEYVKVETDVSRAEKVIRTLRRQFGEKDYTTLCFALSATSPQKAQAVYQTIYLGLKDRCGRGHLLDNLADRYVNQTFTLARGAANEHHHLLGFLRFQELEQGILYAGMEPKNNILTFLMSHFADRFPMEDFLIYDIGRNLFGVHPKGREWYLIRTQEAVAERIKENISDRETEFQELFRFFCHKIAISERENRALQRNLLPIRFRGNMTEFHQG